MTNRLTYVYLCSAAHSGSTLIACLLGAHPEISTVGEFGATFSTSLPCSCGSVIKECDFWSRWADRAASKGIDFKIGNPGIDLQPGPGFIESLFFHQFPLRLVDRVRDLCFARQSRLRQRSEEAIDKSIRLAVDLCEYEETKVFLDTTKNPLQLRFLAARSDIELKVISLVRDGRGVMNSLIAKEKYSPRKSVEDWVWSNRNLHRAQRYLSPHQVLHLRLEDLCRAPDATLTALMQFCEVDADTKWDCSRTSSRHVIGNGMRTKFSGEIRLDEKWRTALSDEHLQLFNQRAGWLNRKLGYE